jgi:hypothetical protein
LALGVLKGRERVEIDFCAGRQTGLRLRFSLRKGLRKGKTRCDPEPQWIDYAVILIYFAFVLGMAASSRST